MLEAWVSPQIKLTTPGITHAELAQLAPQLRQVAEQAMEQALATVIAARSAQTELQA